ncbi:MAG TPA: GNAT family N-acetyltransferase [Chitinophagaceae bacterium]|jgi:hypothetical protein
MIDHRIKYFSRDEIDDEKWNACIANAPNGLIYGYTFYLDAMALHWDALVLDDYKAVMPLTWNKKWGIYYLYQPFLTAQLGLFGDNITGIIFKEFLTAIPAKFRYWDFYLNHGNVFTIKGFDTYLRMNLLLPLQKTYEEISGRYRENIKRNIKKAFKLGCHVKKGVTIEQVIELAKDQMKTYTKPDENAFERFGKLYDLLHAKQEAITYGVFSNKNELLASSVFIFSNKRAYYILVGNHPNGKTLGASHALIDAFIKDHSGKDLSLDFEGSDMHSLAFYYGSFGAVEEEYSAIRLNKLPWYVKWLK